MLNKKRDEMRKRLPVNDPKYIAFKKLKGILGDTDEAKVREDRVNEVITRHKCYS